MTQVCTNVDFGYEVVTVEVSTANGNYSNLQHYNNYVTVDVDISVSAPSGKKVVGGGFETVTVTGSGGYHVFPYPYNDGGAHPIGVEYNGPASDGSSWRFKAQLFCNKTSVPSGALAKVYAVCLSV